MQIRESFRQYSRASFKLLWASNLDFQGHSNWCILNLKAFGSDCLADIAEVVLASHKEAYREAHEYYWGTVTGVSSDKPRYKHRRKISEV